ILAAIRQSLSVNGLAMAEHRLQTRSGEWLWLRTQARTDASGESLIVLKDISVERAREEELLQLSETTALLRSAAGYYVWRYNPMTRAYLFDHDVHRAEGESLD